MEFANELNFLSVIEEEQESADSDSLKEAEKLKWKTDYQDSVTALSEQIGLGDRKFKEKVASKIPIRQDRLQTPCNIFRKEMKEILNEKITSFQEDESDERHENIHVERLSEPDSTFLPQEMEESRVMEISVYQDESTKNSKHGGDNKNLIDNENITEQNWFTIELLNEEARNSCVDNNPVLPNSKIDTETPISFSFIIETSEDKNRGIEHESNLVEFEEEINVSGTPQHDPSKSALREGANGKLFPVQKESLQHFLDERDPRNLENNQSCHEIFDERISPSLHSNTESSSNFEHDPSNKLNYEIISVEEYVNLKDEDFFGKTENLMDIFNEHHSIPIDRNSDNTDMFFEIGETIRHKNENIVATEESQINCSEVMDSSKNLNESFDTVLCDEPSLFSSNANVRVDIANSDSIYDLSLNNLIEISEMNTPFTPPLRDVNEFRQKPADKYTNSETSLFSDNLRSANMRIEETEICAKHSFSQESNQEAMHVDECVPNSHSTDLFISRELHEYENIIHSYLNSEFQDECGIKCINNSSMDVSEYPECHESDEHILEAPAEFRTNSEIDNLDGVEAESFQVSPPRPPSVPEKESSICDNHNTYATEADDTNQRPKPVKPTGEQERCDEKTQGNPSTQESNVSNLSSTESVSLTFTNSTKDNDHVKLEGGNRNVSAYEHVGNNAPIQRHDMLQIDRRERGELADRIGVNSAVLDLRSSHCRGLRRSASFNDRFSGGVNSEFSTRSNNVKHDSLVKLQERLGEVLDLKLTSEQYRYFSVNRNNIRNESTVQVDESQCGDSNNSSSNRNSRSDTFSVVNCNVARETFCQNNMAEVKNYDQNISLDIQFRITRKQDNNNNLSGETCEEDVGHESSESPAVIIQHTADTSFPSTPASSSVEEQSSRAPADAHLSDFRFPKLSSSIHGDSGVPAPAPGCSPTKTAAPKGCVASTHNSPSGITSCSAGEDEHAEEDVHESSNFSPLGEIHKLDNLRWSFKNGRLVFDSDDIHAKNKNVVSRDLNSNEVNLDSIESTDSNFKLSSREVNKRIDENKSRLRYLEEKLKRAGLSGDSQTSSGAKKDSSEFKSDVAKQVVDESESTLWEELKENENCVSISDKHEEEEVEQQEDGDDREAYEERLTHFTGGEDFCQFDVSQVETLSPVLNGYCLVYDELNEESDSEDEFHVISLQEDPNSSEEFYVISNNSRNPGDKMGTDSDRPKHNPDTENLRSLLKRPGKNKDKKSNRVVFNENKNEFFDADYIILIREECDYDDEDDESVCTCNQHEMVRLTCCEPNCNCSVYDGYDPTPQSPKFAPPLEFVDAVTLSPPEGYKDMELGEQQLLALQQMARRGQQRRAVCRECSATHTEDDDGEGSQSDEGGGHHSDSEDPREREKTDQSQQTTPDNCIDDSSLHDFTVDRSPMTAFEKTQSSDEDSVEQRTESSTRSNVPAGGSPISGILKGGKLWKQSSLDGGQGGNAVPNKTQEIQQNTDSSITSDEEGCPRRFVRFIESEVKDQRGGCDGASDDHTEEDSSKDQNTENEQTKKDVRNSSASHDSTEMMLTFKLGNHVLISNNSLKPNSAVRQLFPCTKPSIGKDEESIQQYLVTAESLRAFEEAKRSKLPQIIQNGETDESIKKAIERNTLRRSLIRYEPRNKKNHPKTDNSLVERIKQLTCDVDDDQLKQEVEEIQVRASPPGEEARNSPEITAIKQQDKSFSPSSSSTASSNSSSVSSTYKKLTDLFNKKTDKLLDGQNNLVNNTVQETKTTPTLPDLGNGPHEIEHVHFPVSRINSCTNESRKQFLASLAPLTACVSGLGNTDDYFYQMNNHDHAGQRTSVASSVGTEYSLEDIDEALRNDQEDAKRITPDVLAGTPSASESGDELAMFVQQDAGRIERIKKKYQPESNKEEDDEHDDYGFNKRPSVRGIKPRFGTTTQIIQQIQNQMQPPDPAGRVSWPYYSESGLSIVDNSKTRNTNQNVSYQYPPAAPEDFKSRVYPNSYRPTSLTEENMYQSGQMCMQMYRMNGNTNNYPAVVKLGPRCNDLYQSLPRQKSTGRPLSPPPLEMSKTYHQTMVYIPYNHIEGCQGTGSPNMYYQQSDYARVTNQNQINKRFIEPVYQQRFHMHLDDHQYSTNMATSNFQKQMVRIPYPPQPHGMNCRSESPLSGQYSTARSTQTPVPNCNYYTNQRYRPTVGSAWQGDPAYVSKMNRHSFPMSQRYTTSDTSTDTDSSQGVVPVQNGYRQSIEISLASQKESLGNSPIKSKFTERGVPEGAASVSPPDTIKIGQSSSTMTSPTSPQNVSMQTQKPLFYAMNV